MAALWTSWQSYKKLLPFADTLFAGATDIARSIVLHQLHELNHGKLIVCEADGSQHVFGVSAFNIHEGAGSAASTSEQGQLRKGVQDVVVELRILAPSAWIHILLGNDVGFAEAYMLGEIACSNLTSFFRLFILNSAASNSASYSTILSSLTSAVTAVPFYSLSNTKEQALLNAQSHYSLSNDMFAAFLDPTMTYSAPIWLPSSDPVSSTDNLESAQLRKLDYAISAARITAADHVLEIGTGWGSFAIAAVRRTGCRVTTITASSEQAVLATERVREAGFEHLVEVLVCDYRNVSLPGNGTGRYDKIVSIEMIEHVGASYLDVYFKCVDRYLKISGGIAVFQVITMPEVRYSGYKRRQDFIQRYVFPGGHLPTISGLVASIDKGSNGLLVVEDIKSVGGHYVRALREWREKFLGSFEETIKPVLKFRKPSMTNTDMEIFRRRWEYYFSYCEAGFSTKTLGDVIITVGREGTMELIDNIPM